MHILNKIHNFIDSPRNLIVIYLIAMLVPSVVLACTEPYSVTTIIASMLIPAGMYLLWSMGTKHPGLMILWGVPMMIFCAFQLVISYLFGNSIIAIDMFTNLFTTNVSEAGELLGNIYPSVVIVIVIYIPLIVLAAVSVRRKISLSKRQRIHGVIFGIGFIILGLGMAGISKLRNPDFGIKYHIFPINIGYNIKTSIQRWNQSLDYPKTSKDFRFDSKKEWDSTRREIYVMVIGEASRAMSWSLIGYERETNPRLEKRRDNLAVFYDLLTQSNTTHKSVPILLSSASAENFEEIYKQKSIVEMFREAGFRTVFISNQPANRSLTDYFAAEADSVISITPHDSFISAESHYDIDIVPSLRSIVDRTKESMFIVVHTYGSHASHIKRYPREFAEFLPDEAGSVKRSNRDKVINSYDNTIIYTDYVLNNIISVLDSTKACSALLYCSDHGEDAMDDDRDRFLHASPTTTYYQLHVAAFAWFSDYYSDVFPEKFIAAKSNEKAAATSASVFHTMGDIGGIRCGYIDRTLSLASPLWKERPRMYINDYNKAVNVLETGLTDYDLRMFDKHGIKYNPDEVRRVLY